MEIVILVISIVALIISLLNLAFIIRVAMFLPELADLIKALIPPPKPEKQLVDPVKNLSLYDPRYFIDPPI